MKMYEEIINSLDSEISNLEAAIKLLGGTTKKRLPKNRARRTISPAGKARIAAAQKKRWAKQKVA